MILHFEDRGPVGSIAKRPAPEGFNLKIYPNPSPESTSLAFTLPAPSDIAVTVYDLNGRIELEFMEGSLSEGPQNILIDTGQIPAGTYIVVLRTGSGTRLGKLVRF